MANIAPTVLGNLDAKRAERAHARAARQEARGETLPIVFGGQAITHLGAEFPLYALEPLQDVNLDIALLVQQAMAMATASKDDQNAGLELIISILAANPNLPREFIAAVKEIGRRLLGDSGYAAFVAQRPTPWDVAALGSVLFSWYGVTLGEFWGSSKPSDALETSNPTSEPTSVSTPEASGKIPDSLDSSVSANSLF